MDWKRQPSRVLASVAFLAGGIAAATLILLWTRPRASRGDPVDGPGSARAGGVEMARYAGSVSCRECHERFYELWAPSHHGKAMQPVTAELARGKWRPLPEPVQLGQARMHVDLDGPCMIEERDGQRTTYPILHALGGKNVYYLLTPLERGRLQVLPLAYDVRREEWFDTTQSMIRHFSEQPDSAIGWRDPLLTFNTACYNCHVSQLDKNYDPETDTYHTTWREPGIACEACHGPSEEHNRVCRAAPEGTVPKDLRTILWGRFTTAQVNDACAPCHAKMRQVAPHFAPGERFFDYYDLVCLEDPDFSPDGRDMGENYTHTLWMMNPCASSGALDCTHCHTSSGRFRQKNDPSSSCLPCHALRVRDIEAHSHHPKTPGTPTCISCHAPMTEFARMRRSDHSFRPPCPEASRQFGSPNACLLCHEGETNEWAAARLAQWHPHGRWRKRILEAGALVAAARKGDWTRLPEMVACLESESADPVVVTSLIRLLISCPKAAKWPVVRACAGHASPLVRGAAVDALAENLDAPESLAVLRGALADDARLVRVRAAASLSRLPRNALSEEDRRRLEQGEAELLGSFAAQPDVWSSHYNLGNYRSGRGDLTGALQAYQRAIALRGDVILPYVNAAVTASQLGRLSDSIGFLRRAFALAPGHGAVNLNLGLALAEQSDARGAEKHLRLALKVLETRAQAAYNLAVLVAPRDRSEAIHLCRTAVADAPADTRYAYTLAYFLAAQDPGEAATLLEDVIRREPAHVEAWLLLGQCYEQSRRAADARRHYTAMQGEPALPAEARLLAGERLGKLEP
ncbi:MAG: tetratricopeptide repeat protein [Lentisphaeria bacterium]|nr:tetratricopeptide repeat protein [Lentisphaeria bacterium]